MMKHIGFIFLVLIFLSGCAQANVTPATSARSVQVKAALPTLQASPVPTQASASNLSVVTPTPEPPAPDNSGSVCNNPYYPISDGATWVYDIDGSSQAVHTMSVEEEGSFKIAIVGVDSAAVLEGRCSEAGILLLESGMEGSYFTDSGSSSTSSDYQEGVTLPNNLQVGDEWSQTTGLTAEAGDLSQNARVISNYRVVGVESVTVPAGTFDALKIEQRSTMIFNGQELLTEATLWYALGVGNVRTENGLTGGDRFTLQLISYDIP